MVRTNLHPHSLADIFEALRPYESQIVYVYPPIPVRHHDWQACWDDGEPSIGEGRTREAAALDAFTNRLHGGELI